MPQTILQVMEELPQRVKSVYDSAFRMADEEIKLRVIDSSVILLAIIKLGDTNSSARWLHSTGLTDATVLSFIMEDFMVRKEQKRVRDRWGDKRPIPVIITATESTIKTLSYLGTVRQDCRATGEVYIAHVLEAIAYSDSSTVQRIFGSVGLEMADVRNALNIPSIQDLETLFSRRN